ncbi:MAG: autotransporter outer membrane beta-barrel domain-containing protein [Campylobacteraceae bacterium]|jgi:outer membrane autotransporter protein|nr:autotransporter outer membrane beta-barrel domain-containing protein [Campylobacteraceae bacterium]
MFTHLNTCFRVIFALFLFPLFIYADCIGGSEAYCDDTIDALVYNNSTLDLSNSDLVNIEIAGNEVDGIKNINNGTWNFNSINISSSSSNASGINSFLMGTVSINGELYMVTNASNSKGIVSSFDSYVKLNGDGNIKTLSDYSNAVEASYGSTVNIFGILSVTTIGNRSNAFWAEDSSSITFSDNVSLNVGGFNSHGIVAIGNSNIIGGNSLSVTTYSNNSYAIAAADNSVINAGDNSYIAVNGNNSIAIYSDNSTIALGDNAHVTAKGNNSYGIYTLNDGKVFFGNNTNIQTFNSSYAIVSGGIVSMSAPHFINIQGNIISYGNGLINLDMSDNSIFKGNAILQDNGVISLLINNSTWQMSDDSSVTSLTLDNSSIYLFDGVNSNNTLTIKNLNGDNGYFYLRALSENGTLFGDKIIITDNSIGEFTLNIDDGTSGGIKDPNQTLIIIDQSIVSNTANYNANFTLESETVDIGQYVYTLNSSNALNDRNFYLSTNGTLNSAALSSIGFLNINYLMNYISTQTLIQRLGNLKRGEEIEKGMWIRGYTGKLDKFDKVLNLKEADYYGVSMGVDSIYELHDSDLYAGAFLDFNKLTADYNKADAKTENKAVGFYALYKRMDGFYVDFTGKYMLIDNSFDSVTSGGREIDAGGDIKGYSFSLEGGKKFMITDSFYIEPQGYFAYSKHDDTTIDSSNGLKVTLDSLTSLLGGVNLLAAYQTRYFNLYIKSGYIKEFDGDTSYSFNDSDKKYAYALDGSFIDTALGLTFDLNNRHFYVEGSYQKGDYFNNQKLNLGYRFEF